MIRVRDVILTPAPGWTEEDGRPSQRGEDDIVDDSQEGEAAEVEVRFIGTSVSTEVVNGEALEVVDEAETVEAEPEVADTEEVDQSSEEAEASRKAEPVRKT